MESKQSHLTPFARLVLRVGLAGTFFGHGYMALLLQPTWLAYIHFVGVSEALAPFLLQLIGILDIAVGLFLVFWPLRFVLVWALFWLVVIAVIRPIYGESIIEIIKRGGYMACALVLVVDALRAADSAKESDT